MNTFWHFGCWNQGMCLTNNFKLVADRLKSYKPLASFLVIAGDNYYPEKNKELGTKTIHPTALRSGFDCLPDNLPIDILLGNHDLETTTTVGKQMHIINNNNNSTVHESDCAILQEENRIVKSKKNMHLYLHRYRMFGKHTLVLMIDTSMFEPDSEVEKMLSCYKKMVELKSLPELSVDIIREHQKQFVLKVMRDHVNNNNQVQNIIIIGHHPLSGYKFKKKIKIIENHALSVFLYETLRVNKPMNYYYLCADLHLYQIGTVVIRNKVDNNSMAIKQYIVGTGGTELDPNPITYADTIEEGELVEISDVYTSQYSMTIKQVEISSHGQQFGFLSCSRVKDKLFFSFIPADHRSPILMEHEPIPFSQKTRKSKTKTIRTRKRPTTTKLSNK